MTIAGAAVITAADQLQIHNASGYLKFAAVAERILTSTTLAAPLQNYNYISLVSPATTGTCTTITTTNALDGFVLVLRLGTITDEVTFTDTAVPTVGQLALAGNFTMKGADASLTLICVTQSSVTYWVELARTPGMTVGKVIALSMIFS